MDLRVRHAARLIQVELEVVPLLFERPTDVSDHPHRERPKSILAFVLFGEQRDPRVALIPRRLLGHLEAVAAFLHQIILDLAFWKSLHTIPGLHPFSRSRKHRLRPPVRSRLPSIIMKRRRFRYKGECRDDGFGQSPHQISASASQTNGVAATIETTLTVVRPSAANGAILNTPSHSAASGVSYASSHADSCASMLRRPRTVGVTAVQASASSWSVMAFLRRDSTRRRCARRGASALVRESFGSLRTRRRRLPRSQWRSDRHR